MLTLVMNPGLPEEQSFPLSTGSITIGRTKDNDVFCLHKSLSRRHAKLEFDGRVARVIDLQSKNGVFSRGKRVTQCELVEGDTFQCGDISFLLESATAQSPRMSAPAQTLPSPIATERLSASRRGSKASAQRAVVLDEGRYKDKLFVLIRASDLLASTSPVDHVLAELLSLAAEVLAVDRIVLLTLDEGTLEMKPRASKTFTSPTRRPFSRRVVEWVVGAGAPASFGDVSRDERLPGPAGEAREDASVRAAMCVPINPGGATTAVLYADTVTQPDAFGPDDLALLRAVANHAAAAIERGTAAR